MSPVPINNKEPSYSESSDISSGQDSPTFNLGMQSDSDSETELVNGGYELLPQEPDEEYVGNHQHDIIEETSPGGSPHQTTNVSTIVEPTVNAAEVNVDAMSAAILQENYIPTSCLAANLGAEASNVRPAEVEERRELWKTRDPPKADSNIDMDPGQASLIRNAMSSFKLPTEHQPDWSKLIPEDQWKKELLKQLHNPPSSGISLGNEQPIRTRVTNEHKSDTINTNIPTPSTSTATTDSVGSTNKDHADRIDGPVEHADVKTDRMDGPVEHADVKTDRMDGPVEHADVKTDRMDGPVEHADVKTDPECS